ncbi:MAG: cytochrome c peroxidase [Acidobacteriota bacterium]
MGFSKYARLLAICCAAYPLSVAVTAQRGGIASLKGVEIPHPADAARYVADPQALVVLGKALFWDVQVGSDGRTACATCHFHAGADHRVTNQIAGPATSTAPARPNTTLSIGDFPFHTFANPNDNGSEVTRHRREVVGSAGVVQRTFVAVTDNGALDVGADTGGSGVFTLSGLKVRQVTSRNAPSVINAVFNLRNFWDGRANDTFNAATPFGAADARARVLVAVGGTLSPEIVRLDASSLASQAVGPPLNALEMSFDGRTWTHLGRKMFTLTPLARQTVAGDDSVLGPSANVGGTGLRPDVSYVALIRASFQPSYWSSPAVIDADGRVLVAVGEPTGNREFNQMAYNFGLFFGLAVQAYESTLVSDDTPVDLFLDGDAGALTDIQQQGLNEFRSGGSQCTQCHQGPELSAAGVTTASRSNSLDPRAVGFFRTGVSAIEDDPGAAGLDGSGAPLFPAAPGSRASGAFKSPGLRNVELTGPYFHTGGAATLEQVLEFYARNGDVPGGGNLGPGMGNIRLNQQERGQIVEFLKALTDDRVRFERAPFDHPSLCVPVGYAENPPAVLRPDPSSGGSSAADSWSLVQAVGQRGNAVPLQTFAELLAGVGRDGSRAHTLNQSCAP